METIKLEKNNWPADGNTETFTSLKEASSQHYEYLNHISWYYI